MIDGYLLECVGLDECEGGLGRWVDAEKLREVHESDDNSEHAHHQDLHTDNGTRWWDMGRLLVRDGHALSRNEGGRNEMPRFPLSLRILARTSKSGNTDHFSISISLRIYAFISTHPDKMWHTSTQTSNRKRLRGNRRGKPPSPPVPTPSCPDQNIPFAAFAVARSFRWWFPIFALFCSFRRCACRAFASLPSYLDFAPPSAR